MLVYAVLQKCNVVKSQPHMHSNLRVESVEIHGQQSILTGELPDYQILTHVECVPTTWRRVIMLSSLTSLHLIVDILSI